MTTPERLTLRESALGQYDVVATREGGWWVFDVPGVGATQARTLDVGEVWIADLVETMDGARPASRDMLMTLILPSPQDARVADALALQRAASLGRAAADATLRSVARELADVVTQSDVAALLGVTRWRVRRLLAEDANDRLVNGADDHR